MDPATALQLRSQRPQLLASLVTSTQLRSQMVKPSAQRSVQVPVVASQSGVGAAHTLAQLPHDEGEDRSVSQPSADPTQSAYGYTQALGGITQRPAEQRIPGAAPITFASIVQSISHAPQCATSVARSVHSPPHMSTQPPSGASASAPPPSTVPQS